MDNSMIPIFEALSSVLAQIAIVGISLVFSWIGLKLKDDSNFKTAIAELEKVVCSTIAQLQSLYVDKWKAAQNGKLTKEQVEELKMKTVQLVEAQLGSGLISVINAAGIDLSVRISALQEEFVRSLKAGG